eukprot:scaffold294821_cov37-Prasinocladus_malaysianus.AAC.3
MAINRARNYKQLDSTKSMPTQDHNGPRTRHQGWKAAILTQQHGGVRGIAQKTDSKAFRDKSHHFQRVVMGG